MTAPDIIRIFLALIAVLSMIGIAALLVKRLGLTALSGGVVRKRRLGIVETLALDNRRRLVIVRCDNAEHLLVLGANGETVLGALAADTQAVSTTNSAGAETAPAAPRNPFAASQIVIAPEKSAA